MQTLDQVEIPSNIHNKQICIKLMFFKILKILKIILGCNPYGFRAQPTLHLVSFLSWAECGQCSQPNWPPPSWAECPLSSAHGPRPSYVAQQSHPSATCAGGFGYGPGGKECRWDKLGCLLLVLNIFQLCFQSKISFNKFLIFNPTNTIWTFKKI